VALAARERIALGYGAIALKPIAKTLSMSLKIAALAHERNVPCFCADLTVNPTLLEWNKTLAARMEIHDRNGRVVAEFLARHKKVSKVFYPGLPDHPQHELAKRQMRGFGSMITFETGSLKNANRMLKKLRVCSLGESLGGVETLISHPATMTHAGLGAKGRKAIGITDGMVRISVGIEDIADILDDLESGLAEI